MIIELTPQQPVVVCGTSHSHDPARLKNRIKRGEIAKFDGEAARAAFHLRRHLYNEGITFVKLSKGKLKIKIQRDETMLARPFNAGRPSHRAIVAGGSLEESSELPLVMVRWLAP